MDDLIARLREQAMLIDTDSVRCAIKPVPAGATHVLDNAAELMLKAASTVESIMAKVIAIQQQRNDECKLRQTAEAFASTLQSQLSAAQARERELLDILAMTHGQANNQLCEELEINRSLTAQLADRDATIANLLKPINEDEGYERLKAQLAELMKEVQRLKDEMIDTGRSNEHQRY